MGYWSYRFAVVVFQSWSVGAGNLLRVSDKSGDLDPISTALVHLFDSMLKVAVHESNLKIPAKLKIDFQRTKNREHGDFATNIALALAKENERAPKEIADLLIKLLNSAKFTENLNEIGIKKIEVAGPGFINLFLEQQSRGQVINFFGIGFSSLNIFATTIFCRR